ncbi:bacteriohemerythrin [Clostridiisalibacter paucivorans]|uniref:bacteriohemerythrin n=1 Tax=Clostridiisalibacter paucivorans TaxID=408753 RepID=UPI00047BB577|nr:bacteriohemerythrin [Clostridiisalibacter paucivorans]
MIRWDDSLILGVAEIDSQHKKLFEETYELLDMCSKGTGKSVIEGKIAFLKKYVIEHFESEERLHRKYNYPNTSEHKNAYKIFIEKVKTVEKDFAKSRQTSSVLINVNRIMNRWFLEHIKRTDKAFVEYMKSKK